MKKLSALLLVGLLVSCLLGTVATAYGCVDADRDYWCDDCGMLIPHTCVDYNKDTWCDKCSCWIPHDCADKDSDDHCDQCGKLMDVNINITVTSALSEKYSTTLYFYESTYPNVFAVVSGSPATHSFRCEANSRYRLEITKYGHPPLIFSGNTYLSNIDIDAKLYPYGDASQNGTINVGDVACIYAHVRGKEYITDQYAYQCADINGDKSITVGDTAKVYAHIRGVKTLF